jgi:hypothetical protein
MNNKVIQHAQVLVQSSAVPSVMNHGDARHFGPYGRLGSSLGTVGISVIVRANSVLRAGIHRFMCLVPANISSMSPQDPDRGSRRAEKWCFPVSVVLPCSTVFLRQ